jgi:hypothetical protein
MGVKCRDGALLLGRPGAMNVAGKIGAPGAPADAARARARRDPAPGFRLDPGATRSGEARNASAATPVPPSPHAQRSAAQLALLEAQAQASPALERLPAALRARAAAAFPGRSGSSDLSAAAASALDRLRDRREMRPGAAPPSDAELRKGAAAYQRTIELSR